MNASTLFSGWWSLLTVTFKSRGLGFFETHCYDYVIVLVRTNIRSQFFIPDFSWRDDSNPGTGDNRLWMPGGQPEKSLWICLCPLSLYVHYPQRKNACIFNGNPSFMMANFGLQSQDNTKKSLAGLRVIAGKRSLKQKSSDFRDAILCRGDIYTTRRFSSFFLAVLVLILCFWILMSVFSFFCFFSFFCIAILLSSFFIFARAPEYVYRSWLIVSRASCLASRVMVRVAYSTTNAAVVSTVGRGRRGQITRPFRGRLLRQR